MHLSTQFPELFRQETYAVNLALVEERQLSNVFDEVLAHRSIDGVWDKEYSMVPFGEMEGRDEGDDIKQKNMTMGYTAYGAISIEASGKVGLSKTLKQRSRDFSAAGGGVDEPKFAGHIADTASRAFLIRRAQRFRKLTADIFNLGGIQAGNAFFNHRDRCHMSDVPDSDLIYDGMPLFARPANAHPSYASGAVIGSGARAVGNYVDWDMAIADTGGYFNAFDLPPSYWALKRVVTHFKVNMQYDENDEAEEATPDTLLVSDHNLMLWMEILNSKFVNPQAGTSTTDVNTENVFMMENMKMKLVSSRDLIPNTWFVGQSKSQGILVLDPSKVDDPWSYWREEKDRSYWVAYEDEWGFMIRNWRRWCAGAISTDGTTPPTFHDTDEVDWRVMPDGI
ncbi:MAG: hypothetical protein WC822_01520 [Candidatus Paceibacterota bacterium]|jgi:hypothetical protein